MFAEVSGSMGSYRYDLSIVDSDGQRRNIQLIRSQSTEISNDRSILQNSTLLTQLSDHHRKHDGSLSVEQVVNQNLSFLDFDFMANELFDVTDGFIQA